MIKIEDITFVAAEAYKRSGLVLSTDKGYLLESRLAPLARRRQERDRPEQEEGGYGVGDEEQEGSHGIREQESEARGARDGTGHPPVDSRRSTRCELEDRDGFTS